MAKRTAKAPVSVKQALLMGACASGKQTIMGKGITPTKCREILHRGKGTAIVKRAAAIARGKRK